MKKHMITLALTLTLNAVLLTGCWNYRELDTMAIVAGMAFDKSENGTGYHLTAEILDEAGGGGEQGPTIKSQIVESDGATMFDAARNALKRSNKKLYYGDCQTVIFGDEVARDGIAPLLDWFVRDPEPRITIDIYISKAGTAKEIIEKKSLGNPITSFALAKIDENNPKSLSKSIYTKIYQATNMLGGEGISLTLPALDITLNQNEALPEIDGVAVFKKDRLLGYLESEESKYLAFLKDQVIGGLLLINMESAAPDISLEILKNNTKITPDLTGGLPKIKIETHTQVSLGELLTSTDLITASGLEAVEKRASETMEKNIRELISKVQREYGTDIFGFGSAIYKADPEYWKKIKPQWDRMFSSLDIEISSEINLKTTAHLRTKIKAGE